MINFYHKRFVEEMCYILMCYRTHIMKYYVRSAWKRYQNDLLLKTQKLLKSHFHWNLTEQYLNFSSRFVSFYYSEIRPTIMDKITTQGKLTFLKGVVNRIWSISAVFAYFPLYESVHLLKLYICLMLHGPWWSSVIYWPC